MFAIIPAAGDALRMGSLCASKTKVLLPVTRSEAGAAHTDTILALAISSLLAGGASTGNRIKGLVVAVRSEDEAEVKELLSEICQGVEWMTVVGGGDRQDSVYNALLAIEGKAEKVLVHDGARPLCPAEDIDKIVAKAQDSGSAILAIPSRSTLKQVVSESSDGAENLIVRETIPRQTVWEAQTPQVFSYNILRAAHEKARQDGFRATDDSMLVERLGHQVHVVEGTARNIKITTPEDLLQAELLLANS